MNKSNKEVWCKHMVWTKDYYSEIENFCYEMDDGNWVHEKWNFCPICGAKRPGGKHGTK